MIGFGVAAGIVAAIALLAFLCARQLTADSGNSKHRILAKSLDVVIAPLLIAFVMIIAMKIAEILA